MSSINVYPSIQIDTYTLTHRSSTAAILYFSQARAHSYAAAETSAPVYHAADLLNYRLADAVTPCIHFHCAYAYKRIYEYMYV